MEEPLAIPAADPAAATTGSLAAGVADHVSVDAAASSELYVPDGQPQRAYRAVFFDLDGTLLPMELDEFMGSYYTALGAFMVAHGCDAAQFGMALKAGIKEMAAHGLEITNEEAFFQGFYRHVDKDSRDWYALFLDFYENDFGRIGDGVVPDPAAVRAVRTLSDKGYALALATMPMFPRRAVEWRLQWAGIDPQLFSRITSFENSASVKPKLTYYAENLAAAGVRGSDVLMVGNNTIEDLAALDMGTDGFLVTDHVVDAVGYDFATVKHGSMEAFARWVEQLPACADPVTGIETGCIDPELTRRVYEQNAVARRLDEDAMRIAAGAYTPHQGKE